MYLEQNSTTETCIFSSCLACSRECMQFSKPLLMEAIRSSNQQPCMQTGYLPPTKKGYCAQGFSENQINIISVIKSYSSVLSYWQIAEITSQFFQYEINESQVRGSLERLSKKGIFHKERARNGKMQGNKYLIINEPCKYIRSLHEIASQNKFSDKQPPMNGDRQISQHSGENQNPSILKEIDNKNLSILKNDNSEQKLEALTEVDIEFHFPNIAKHGFGTKQIRQIVFRLKQVEIDCSQVMQGLIHAEWELENNCMRGKEGVVIQSPINWVFQILAKQGYYPRPKSYISPQEQAKLDEKYEHERIKDAYQEERDAKFKAWEVTLSENEKQELFEANTNSRYGNREVILKSYFFSKVDNQKKKQNTD